jgi:hypothetical protein
MVQMRKQRETAALQSWRISELAFESVLDCARPLNPLGISDR